MLSRLRRRVVGRLQDEAGITLSELMVVMGLFTVIGTMATMFLVGSSEASRSTLERTFNTSTARLTLDSWTSLLRVADSPVYPGSHTGRIVKVTPTGIVFYANIGNRDSGDRTPPTKIDLSIVNGQLVEKRMDGTSGALLSTRNLGTGAAVPSGWLFTPYNGTTPLSTSTLDCTSNGVATAGYCGAYTNDGSSTVDGELQLQTITRIDINFTITDSASLAPTAFSSTVAITGSRNS